MDKVEVAQVATAAVVYEMRNCIREREVENASLREQLQKAEQAHMIERSANSTLRETVARIRSGVVLMVPEPQKSGFLKIIDAINAPQPKGAVAS